MIRSLYFKSSGELQTDLQPEMFKVAIQDLQGVLWVDFVGEAPQDCEKILLEDFGFHPLAVDDALQETHVPKVDDWDQYLYIALHDIRFERGDDDIESFELDVFLGVNYIVTHHDFPIPALDRVWTACHRDERYLKHGPDRLLYHITDELAANYMQVIESLDEQIEWVEGEVFSKPTSEMVQRIFSLRRITLHLRRFMSPLREVLNKLARDDFAVIDNKDRIYFRDVYDHLVRLHDISEGLRDLAGGVLDTYLSVINNRMNEIMKTLTLITTMFMPISFVVGFFGMNFFQPISRQLIPSTGNTIFIITMLIIMLTPAAMYGWMRRRKWM